MRLSSRFQQYFTHEKGHTLRGSIQPVEDSKIYNDDYFAVRQIIRVFSPARPKPGEVIRDTLGQHYLLGELDSRGIYHAYRTYPTNAQLEWTRQETEIDPLTQLEKNLGEPTFLGHLHVLSEVVVREDRGGDIKTREPVTRILTGAKVEMDDFLGGKRVTKINRALGIAVVEVQ